ncbi:MAG: NAD(P)/FAD-dependent oxidoreductase [archaeon]
MSKKITIIGCSISGSIAAFILAKSGFDVSVYEQNPKERIHQKICANIVTSSFIRLMKEIGLDTESIIKRKFAMAEFYSQSNSVKIPVTDYEIDRQRLLHIAIIAAQKFGAKFYFNSRVIEFEDTPSGINITVQKTNEKNPQMESFDYCIGADGSLSTVSRKSGLWQNRKFWLAIQSSVSKSKISCHVNESAYKIFFIPHLGYYSYIFPSGENYTIGILADPQKAKARFSEFCDFIGVKNCKIESALIPIPKKLNTKKGNIFIIGDAACHTKFSGGGIVPSIEAAIALGDILRNGKWKRMNSLSREIMMHQMITKILSKLSAQEFDNLFMVANKKDIKIQSRDEMRKWAVSTLIKNPGLILLGRKLFNLF